MGHPQEDEAGKVNVIKQICSEAGAQERVVDSGPRNGDGEVNQSSRSQRAEAASQDPNSMYKSRRHTEILGAGPKGTSVLEPEHPGRNVTSV